MRSSGTRAVSFAQLDDFLESLAGVATTMIRLPPPSASRDRAVLRRPRQRACPASTASRMTKCPSSIVRSCRTIHGKPLLRSDRGFVVSEGGKIRW